MGILDDTNPHDHHHLCRRYVRLRDKVYMNSPFKQPLGASRVWARGVFQGLIEGSWIYYGGRASKSKSRLVPTQRGFKRKPRGPKLSQGEGMQNDNRSLSIQELLGIQSHKRSAELICKKNLLESRIFDKSPSLGKAVTVVHDNITVISFSISSPSGSYCFNSHQLHPNTDATVCSCSYIGSYTYTSAYAAAYATADCYCYSCDHTTSATTFCQSNLCIFVSKPPLPII
ncbi:transcription factor E2F8 [Striga asiatica]|uniref:Transcription factor E2F8 n=1 Tax=Striga asiatica TaxID=4170 RepID=A0A5A7QE23_STRAF|nr:transcription factor E2F8 [Striga asiatica]